MSPRLGPLLLGGVVLLLALALGCSSSKDVVTADVVSVIPWQGDESFAYVVQDKEGKQIGDAVLEVASEGDETRLSQRFSNDTNTDAIDVLVDPQTLKPVSSHREITAAGSDDVTLEVTYTDEGVLIRQGDKQSGLTVPEHAYDNDTSLFLWRTLPFGTGYTGAYVTIITNHRSSETVRLAVLGKESVTVPAGTFDAWKLEIRAGGVRQLAWYADTPGRPLVKYDNSLDTFYELTSAP